MPLFPVKRYFGDEEENTGNNEDTTSKNLQALLSKVKHRIKEQRPNTSVVDNINDSCTASTDKLLHKVKKTKRINDNNLSKSKKIKRDVDGTNNMQEDDNEQNNMQGDDGTDNVLLSIQRLKVGDNENNDTANISNLADGDIFSVTKGAFPIIGDIKFKKKIKVKRVLPDWLANPSIVSQDLKHLDVSVHDIPELHNVFVDTLKKNNITHFFPVQAQVIPCLLNAACQSSLLPPGDICVSAPTGSGKTLAYAIPILQLLMGRQVGQIQALIVLPVQDLATQVYSVLKAYSTTTGLRVHLSTGALPLIEDRANLLRYRMCVGWESMADILVVTPGRLVEHLYTTPGFTLRYLRFIVIDEADRVIDSHQNNWLHHLDQHLSTENNPLLTVQNMRTAPKRPRKLLFSATLSSDPEKLNHLHLFQPRLFTSVVETTISQGEFVGQISTPAELRQSMVRCVLATKPLVLFHLITKRGWSRVLVFVSSTRSGHNLTALLTLLSKRTNHTLIIAEISAECSPRHRESLLSDFASGKIDVLISTDQLARGIDIPDVQYVVSYDMPKYVKAYIHRVGRTGRAGHEGMAVTLVTHSQVTMLHQMLQNTGIMESMSELNIDVQDLKTLQEPFKQCFIELRNFKQEEEVKNVNKIKLAKRGYTVNQSTKRKRKIIPKAGKKLKNK